MRLLAATIAVMLAALPALGEIVRVRSSDIGDLTRVAIEFATLPEWRAERTQEGFSIRLPENGNFSFDTGPMFRSAESGRLRGIRTASEVGQIDILLGCDCQARIYEFRDNSIVLDIWQDTADADPDSGSRALLSAPPVMEDGPAPDTWTFVDASDSLTELFLPELMGGASLSRTPSALPAARLSDSGDNLARRATGIPDGSTDIMIGDLQGSIFHPRDSHAIEMLSRELSRAIAQGLVDAPDLSRPLPHPTAQPGPVEALASGRSNLSITTAIDRDVGVERERPGPTSTGSVCLPDSEFDLSAWGDPYDITQLGDFRDNAFEEDGSISGQGMLSLIRFYLAMGFGAEAVRLTGFLDDESQKQLLRTMARIIDHGENDNAILDGQVFCKGKVALWSMLAHPVPASHKPSDTDNILAAFSELPLHIRIQLGPVLSERLRELGFDAEAQIALNAVTRGGGHTPAQDLTAARLGLAGTTADVARGELETLSHGTDLIAAEALLELLLDAERRGVPPDPAWVADAPSLVRATLGTKTAEELNLAGLRGRIALGQFDILREALNEGSPGVTKVIRRELAAKAIGEAGAVADEATLLRTELAFSKIADTHLLPNEQRLQLAERLTALGLPDRALAYVTEIPVSDVARRIKAEVLADLQRFDEAIAILSDGTSPELLNHLGAVLLRSGRPAEAVDAFAKASEFEKASFAAIRDANWTWLEANSDETLSTASRELGKSSATPIGGSGVGNIDLLKRSAQRRAQAKLLLERTKIELGASAFTN